MKNPEHLTVKKFQKKTYFIIVKFRGILIRISIMYCDLQQGLCFSYKQLQNKLNYYYV